WEGPCFPAPIKLPFGNSQDRGNTMFRLRLATVAVAASLGLVSGCVCLPDFPLVARIRARLAGDCCGGGGVAADCEGPAMDAVPGNAAIMGGPGITPIPSMAPQNTMPSLAPPPRI